MGDYVHASMDGYMTIALQVHALGSAAVWEGGLGEKKRKEKRGERRGGEEKRKEREVGPIIHPLLSSITPSPHLSSPLTPLGHMCVRSGGMLPLDPRGRITGVII